MLASVGSLRAEDFPPSPYDILHSQDLDTPILDAARFCQPDGLAAALDPVLEQAASEQWQVAREMLADWSQNLDRPGPELTVLDAVLEARSVRTREDRLALEQRLRALLRAPELEDQRLCLRLELARLLMWMSRHAEAAAQLTRANRIVEERGGQDPRGEQIAFARAEILYARGLRFEAHLAYRKLAHAENRRLALASRLRLTDLSFDAGKVEDVSAEYEALLPRASAFGASTLGWALRASEAALDSGDPNRALRWLEAFLEEGGERDARDAAEIRLADIDAAFEDPLGARARLASVSGRRRGDAIGALAAVRAIALGVSSASPEQRIGVLLQAVRDQRGGVRRYALGVMMKELALRNDFDGALAVATRLAYEGLDPVVTPDYTRVLDALLLQVTSVRDESGSEGTACRQIVRALGGRYGILIERSNRPAPFARVGTCFEEMELPWLAATVYRSITRRFGTQGAQQIALPLARVSLEIGEVTLARRMATAALENPDDQGEAWTAILAEADFREGRYGRAARGLREVLDSSAVVAKRGELARMLARTLELRGSLADARFLAARVAGWLDRHDLQPGARSKLIEAAMLTGHALRLGGHVREAAPLYRVVDENAEAGALRSSARFWLGHAQQPDARNELAWGQEPAISLGSPWARYAEFEERFRPLSEAYASVTRNAGVTSEVGP